ncbi:Uncharacterized protein FKW44_003881 [Caligus rogercresseyi]|uniref:Uncharacterized protein n=1 Tax=Caligus rogercresseyi TaxID=217165 RepID=A0A7T8KMC4_CALRO|nr:Uncharacterized protein FKW44_003881 [Caligus rogercresseyi]
MRILSCILRILRRFHGLPWIGITRDSSQLIVYPLVHIIIIKNEIPTYPTCHVPLRDKCLEGQSFEPRTFDLSLGSFNSSVAITGSLIIGGLLVFSAVLYALDIYATSRIDRMLIYNRFSNAYEPTDYADFLAGAYADYSDVGTYRRRRRRQATEGTKLSPNNSRVMGLINLAFAIYNAADESLRVPECRKKLVCEVYSRPDDVLGDGYLGKTIKKGIEYLPYIQEKYNENRPCKTKSATCNHLEKVLSGMNVNKEHDDSKKETSSKERR